MQESGGYETNGGPSDKRQLVLKCDLQERILDPALFEATLQQQMVRSTVSSNSCTCMYIAYTCYSSIRDFQLIQENFNGHMVLTNLFCMYFQGLHVAPPTSHAPSSRGRGQGSSGSPTSAVSSTLPLYTLRVVSTLPAEVSFNMHTYIHTGSYSSPVRQSWKWSSRNRAL